MSVQASKFLSYVLRHSPASIGLELDPHGWADVGELIEKANAFGNRLDINLLNKLVAQSDKKRFTLSPDGKRIRAAQGHSVNIDLGLLPMDPPSTLYHGTASRFLTSILKSGLRPGDRRHVHLSTDEQTAIKVGQRHGEPVVLLVDSQAMLSDGHEFYLSENGVWLTDIVPPKFISVASGVASGRPA